MKAGDHVKPTVRLVSRLGAGGMGSVWLAENTTLGIPVAVKLMMPHHANDEELRLRFKQEAHILARVHSPHVVQVLDYGETDAGLPYILMELLDGETLGSRLQRLGPLPLADVARVVTQVASALGRAHEFGIVHRDLKPENLFLIQVGGELFVKVIDFGIAKLPPADLQKLVNTVDGQLIGTPNYMSPEAMVNSKDVDHRADVWALAAIAYEALTGRRPFLGQSFGEMILVVHAGVFTKPSVLQPGLPQAIDVWAERALQREPGARFGSVREAADAFAEAVRTAALAVTAPAVPQAQPIAPPPRAAPASQPGPRPRAEPGSQQDSHRADPTLMSGDREIVPMELCVGKGRVRLLLGSLLRAGAEAIVNATDGTLSGGGAVNAMIRAAAGPDLDEELRRIGTCDVGGAVLTTAGRIPPPARFLIHTVGPNYALLGEDECAVLLRRAHTESLRLAAENGVQSVAFPVISAECNGYPIRKAAPIAFSAAVDHLLEHTGPVTLIVFALTSLADFTTFGAALGAAASALPPRARD